MVLHPLEFAECYLDSPWFRKSIQDYEEELERTNTQIKHLIKDGKNMLQASRTQSKMMTMFNDRLQNFQFECIGENLTDDEKGIAGSLKEFGLMLHEVAREWDNTIERSETLLIKPLEAFRKEHIHSYRDAKKSFEKASERYYKQLEHTLGLSHKKKEQHLQVSDKDLLAYKKAFHREALSYVYKLQEVEERKKFEFVEHLLMFMQVYFNFFHQSHETANDCKDYMKDLQMRLVATREQFEGTRDKTQTLMRSIEDQADSEDKQIQLAGGQRWSRAGYLFLMEKNPLSARLTSKWSRYFCMYTEANKLFQMMSANSSSSNVVASSMGALNLGNSNSSTNSSLAGPMIVKTCTRRITDSIDKRFCFDLELEDTAGKQHNVTMQATSDPDRKRWMSVMDGKEPDYIQTKDFLKTEYQYQLNDLGFDCVKQLIAEIERRGVDHEGIYRLVGVMSKVDLLLRKANSPATASNMDYSNDDEWEINTLTSALKSFFRKLPEPVMTYDLHRDFINAAKCETHEDRVAKVMTLVNKLPEKNKKVLSLLTEHLQKVQSCSEKNKMTAQNLGVCFGPTLMKDKQETVQSILEIKFSNIIVEILIEERQLMFGGGEDENFGNNIGNASPKPSAKPTYIARLPSQRLKQRPRGMYEATSVPSLLEEDSESALTPKSKFARSRAFRSNQGRTSPNTKAKTNSKIIRQPSMSSSDEDGYGHISPLDLNLNLKGLTTPSDSSSVVLESIAPPIAERISKEEWTPNGGLEASTITEELPNIPPRTSLMLQPFRERSLEDALSDESSRVKDEAFLKQNVKKDSQRDFKVPEPKKRVSSFTRTKQQKTSDSKAPTYATVQKNNNNSSSAPNSSNSSSERSLPAKPKSLHLSTSLKTRKKKLLASMKEGLSSPAVPVKYSRKKINSEPKLKSPAGDSSLSRPSIKKSQRVTTRPKPKIIPNSFTARELNDDEILEDNSRPTPGERPVSSKPNMPPSRPAIPNKDFVRSRPRSSPVIRQDPDSPVSPTSPVNSEPQSPETESECTDEDVVLKVARTLYECRAEHESELSFHPGQMIKDVRMTEEPGWLMGVLNGKVGLVPRNYIEFL
ncbi:rho GTPase-activating protein 26-like isoform X2 [Clavelina lepadiformis]|uniref:rho GTPase-activating protein 26-like isoform X2 n=1 Tax=Clavelina lepadiformis TaxID=159417 RepID=UPI00404255D1